MPDTTLTQAIREAYASAPRGVVIYHTLEIRHSTFTEPIRIVRDHADLEAYLESDAPENAGEEVFFSRFSFDFTKPEISADGVPQMQVAIDNISRDISAALDLAVQTTDLVEVTYREFISTDLSGPQNDPPITMYLIDVKADIFKVHGTARFPDLLNKRFPTLAYDAEVFTGLVRDR